MQCARCDHDFPAPDRFCGRCGLARSEDGRPIDPLIGMTLADRYVVERRIGVGGMGTVYLGTHNRIGQKVAIKVLHERYAQDEQLTQRFENEALAYGRVAHPNLVGLHDFGRGRDALLFMVLEYCPGVPLSQLLRDRKRLPAPLAIDVVTQVAQGLGAAHAAGFVHRDLKPENVVLMETRPGHFHVKLLDFGIAKALDDDGPKLTQAGMVFGTPEYMAPEQARGESVDIRSDIYALGAMLYELVTGRPPFYGSNKMKVMHRQATEAPEPFADRAPDLHVPDGVEAIAMRCLEKRQADRYPDTKTLIEAMDAVGKVDLTPLPIARTKQVDEEEAPPETAMPPLLRVSQPDEGPSGGIEAQEASPWAPPRHTDLPSDALEMGEPARFSARHPVEPPQLPNRGAMLAAAIGFCAVVGLAALLFSRPGSPNPGTSSVAVTTPSAPESKPAGPKIETKDTQKALASTKAADEAEETKRAKAEARRREAKAKAKAQAKAKAKAQAEKRATAEAIRRADKRAKADKKKRIAAARLKDAKRARDTAMKRARKDLRMGRFVKASRRIAQLLKSAPKDKEAAALGKRIDGTQDALAQGRLAFERSECPKAIAALEPVLDVSPGASGVSHMVNSCRKAMPPAKM